jgi:hypothetical protein
MKKIPKQFKPKFKSMNYDSPSTPVKRPINIIASVPDKKPKSNVVLSKEQNAVVEAAISKKSLFLTGNAGTGKSVVLREIVKVLKKKFMNDDVAQVYVTAPTGVAACNINGCTIHSWAGLGIGELDKNVTAKAIMKNKNKREKWENTKVLIIDEISMVSSDMFDMLEYIARFVRKSSLPFGGIQVILCGDFLQLPPITKGKDLHFCFEAESWKDVVKQTFELTKQFRQTNDTKFTQILNEIRIGQISKESELELKKCIKKQLPEGKIEATKLYPHKDTVSSENSTRLGGLKGDSTEFKAQDKGDQPFLDTLKKNCSAPERLILKEGAQVILLKNLSVEEGLVNGSRGIISDFATQSGNPIVQFANQTCEIEQEDFTLVAGNEIKATRRQYPLDLAWAISIHKSQGMTIDFVQTSLNTVFEYGQAYVALSRCRSLEGLTITEDFDVKKFRAHPKVLDFYSSFQKVPARIPLPQMVVRPPVIIATKPPIRVLDQSEVIDLELDDDLLEEMSLSQNNVVIDVDVEEIRPPVLIPCNLKEYMLGPSCVNEAKRSSLSKLLLGRGHLESEEGDPRLLIEIPFSSNVDMEEVRIGWGKDSRPNKISFYFEVSNKDLLTIAKEKPRYVFEYPGSTFHVKSENTSYVTILMEGDQVKKSPLVITSFECMGKVNL